jgi:hypothetical protein
MRGTKEMVDLLSWMSRKGKHTGSKNTNKPRSKQLACMQRASKRRNRRLK